jgi:adenosylcobinamide kinase/adenosylcobinamide-phosphate guanylyltransferase
MKMGFGNTILVTGGCKSGKSRHALRLAESSGASSKLFIATCVAQDDEMRQRVQRHRQERGVGWSTLECPVLVPEAVLEHGAGVEVILIDCLTLWLSNILLECESAEQTLSHVRRLADTLRADHCPVIMVTNEVGAGIVPENRLARLYRDIAGMANQTIASVATRVDWVVAGIPVTIKGP